MRFVHYTIATAFGFGYSPTAPGTAGTILALATAYLFFDGNPATLGIATVLATFIGIYSGNYVEKDLGKEDPSIVVIDEVAGMWLGLILVPLNPWLYLLAFGLFRLFDVTKLYPIDYLQRLPGGWGIMLDDIGAGIYTFIIMQIVIYFL